MAQLTPNAVQQVFAGGDIKGAQVQVIDVKGIQPAQGAVQGAARFRIVISDGTKYGPAMLSSQLNTLVVSNEVKQYTVLRVQESVCNNVKGKKIIIIINADVVQQLAFQIGKPECLDDGEGMSGNQPAMQQPQQPMQPMQYAPPLQPQQQYAPAPQYMPPQMQQPQPMYGAPQPMQYGAPNPYGVQAHVQQAYGAPPMQQQMPYGAPPMQPQLQVMPPQQQQQKQFGGYGAKPEAAGVMPISALNPYSAKWKIKVRVTSKSQMKTFKSQKGEGKLFSVDFLDEQGGEIRATAFNQDAERLDSNLIAGNVYFVSCGNVKAARDNKWAKAGAAYEITFNKDTTIEWAGEDSSIEKIHYNFVTLEHIAGYEANKVIDIVAVVKKAEPITEIRKENAPEPLKKRQLMLVDQSLREISLTLWNEQARLYDENLVNPVIAVKGVKVGDFGGKSLSTTFSASIAYNPDLKEAAFLRQWYDAEGKDAMTMPVAVASVKDGVVSSSARELCGALNPDIGKGEKPDYITVRATIVNARHDKPSDIAYPACRADGCSKKVTGQDNSWYCEKCNKQWEQPLYRYITSCEVTDMLGKIWISLFNDSGEQLFGLKADDLVAKKECNDPEAERIFSDILFTDYIIRLRAKEETYNDTKRVKFAVQKISRIDPVAESKQRITEIKELLKNPQVMM